MTSNEENPDENHSKKDKPANNVKVDWTMVLFGIGATGLGIAIVTNLITVNIFYQNIRWLLIVIGIIAILWGFASGKKR